MEAVTAASTARNWTTSLLLAVILVVPFLNKAIHIDDTVVLAVSEQILADPLNPLGGEMDWFGHLRPLWKVTTNPPLLSYYLAPVLGLSGADETLLHLMLIPVLALLAFSLRFLTSRFCGFGWLPVFLILLSPAFWPSINLMRDVPAVALGCAAVAAVVTAVDRRSTAWMIAAGVAAGLAVMTKYSMGLIVPVVILYPLLHGRLKMAWWLLPGHLIPAGWCLWTWWLYGAIHPLFLVMGGHANRPFGLADRLAGALTITGSALLITPWLLWVLARRRKRTHLIISGAVTAILVTTIYLGGGTPFYWQSAFWMAAGALLLSTVIVWSVRPAVGDRDTAFLLLWAILSLGGALLGVPFQAVRHLLPLLPPLTLLAFRLCGRSDSLSDTTRLGPATLLPGRSILLAILMIQAALAAGVAVADASYADCYRNFARGFGGEDETTGQAWFVGHWGWQFYAEQAGIRQLHRDGPFPQAGDRLIWPDRVHIGDVWRGGFDRSSLQLVDERTCTTGLPIRTMNFQGAAFYSVIRGNAPFAFQRPTLETFRVYQVVEPNTR